MHHAQLVSSVLFAVAVMACRSDEEQDFIDKCTTACEREHDGGCGMGARADCLETCEQKCDDGASDCLDEETRLRECQLATADICVDPASACSEEESNVLACIIVEAIVPFSAR